MLFLAHSEPGQSRNPDPPSGIAQLGPCLEEVFWRAVPRHATSLLTGQRHEPSECNRLEGLTLHWSPLDREFFFAIQTLRPFTSTYRVPFREDMALSRKGVRANPELGNGS